MKAEKHYTSTAPEMSDTQEFAAAMIILSSKARIYWRFVIMHEVVWTYEVKTAATDGVYIYINPNFFGSLPNDCQRAFLLGHEVGHIVLKHPQRGKAFRLRGFFRVIAGKKIPFIHRLYNWAADCVINADLVAHGLESIEGALYDDRFSRDHLVDDAYAILHAEEVAKQEEAAKKEEEAMKNPAPESDGGDDSDDSDDSADDSADGGDDSETDGDTDTDADGEGEGEETDQDGDSGEGEEPAAGGDDHGGQDIHLEPKYSGTEEEQAASEKEDERQLDHTLEDAVSDQEKAIEEGEHKDVGMSRGCGERVSAAQNRGIAPITWRDEIPDLLQNIGKGDGVSFAKIHRRRFNLYGVVSPVSRGSLHQLALTIDISYSVDRSALQQWLHVMADVIDELQPINGTIVLFTNHEVAEEPQEIFSGAELLDLDIPQGGGTHMSAAVEWLTENGHYPDAHLVFTDGEMSGRDVATVAESGAVIILDRTPDSYVKKIMERNNARVIIADDDSLAA